MSDYVSKDNYWRIFSMYFDLGTEILLKLFKNYIDKAGHQDISTFFNSTEIKDKLTELKKKKIIENHEFMKVTAPDPKLGGIDITLMIKLITNLFSDEVNFHNAQPGAMDTTIGADIYRMRRFRNKLVHIPKAELCTSKFEYLWKKIAESMLRVAGIINDDEKRRLSKRIAEYREKQTNAVEKEKMCEILDDWKKQYESLKEKVKDLYERMFSFDLLLKSAPKRYIRYLKLLFECGMLTLSGILKRELESEKQTLTNILNQHKDTLTKAITNDDDVNQIYPPDQREADPNVWSLSLLATVILNTFTQLNEQDKSKIKDLKHAADENQIREKALMLLLETEYLLKQTSKLVHVITVLAVGIDEESKAKCFQYVEQYPDLEIKDDVTIEKYLKELRKQGETVIGLDELHKELIGDLRAYVRQMCDSSAVFKGPKEIQIKIVTLCEDQSTEHFTEETMENIYREVSSGSTVSLNQSSHRLTKELQKLINSLSSHPDVKLSGIKRNCITLLITCSSYEGILHIIEGMDLYVDKFCDRISDELSYLYGEVVVLKGNLTFESIYNVLTMQSSEQLEKGKSGLCITLESETLKGIQHVIATIGDYETKSSLSVEESSQSLRNVSILAFPYISELPEFFDETESEEEEEEKEKEKEEEDISKEDEIDKIKNVQEVLHDIAELYQQINQVMENIKMAESHVLELKSDNIYQQEDLEDNSNSQMKKTEMCTLSEKHKDEKRYTHTEDQTDSFNSLKDMKKIISGLVKDALHSLKGLVSSLKALVSSWKENFRLFYVGLRNITDINEIAKRCGSVEQILYEMQNEIIPLLFNIHVDCNWSTEKLLKDERILKELSSDLIRSTFVITEQKDCYIRMDRENLLPGFTVRILATEKLPQYDKQDQQGKAAFNERNPHMTQQQEPMVRSPGGSSIMVEAMLVPQRFIDDSYECDDAMQELIREKEKIAKISSNQIYLIPHKGAIFKRLKVVDLVQDSSERESGVALYSVVFYTTLADKILWVLSQPMALLTRSEPDQEMSACISIHRQLFGRDFHKLPLYSQKRLPWPELEGMLQAKFTQLCLTRPLSDVNVLHLKEILFGTTDVSEVASLEEFLSTKEDTSILMHNFWNWITDVHNLIAQYLLQFWKDGLITGFLSMNTAKWTLNEFQPARHGTFILRFSEPNLRMGEALEYTHVHLKAYALEIKERNVSLYNLPTSNLRKLGKYFEKKDDAEDVPRWKLLIQTCGLQITHSIKRHIENAINPGAAFLEELEKKRYMIEDLAGCFKQHEMYEGLDILHAKEEHESVLSVSYFTFRDIGLAFERSYTVQVDDGEEIPCWNYIIHWNEELSIIRKHEVNIGKSARPGEKFLDIFNDCGFKLSGLIKTCKDLGLDGITHILESSKHDAYLEKTIVDVDICGARELERKGFLDILKEKQKTVGNLLLRYLYPGNQTLQQLQEKYTYQT